MEEEREGSRTTREGTYLAVLRTGNVKSLAAVMASGKMSTKQTCSICLTEEGLWIRAADASKTLQSIALLRAGMFGHYVISESRVTFGVDLSNLVDALNVFSQSMGGELEFKYPSMDGEILLELRESMGGRQISSYAKLGTLMAEDMDDWMSFWEEPSSSFIASGGILREVAEDLESLGGNVRVSMLKDPPRITFSARDDSKLTIEIPVSTLFGYHMDQIYSENYYGFRQLKSVFGSVSLSRDAIQDVKTNVKVDNNGLMKVIHMLTLAVVEPMRVQCSGQEAHLRTQRLAEEARTCTLTYFLQPQELLDD